MTGATKERERGKAMALVLAEEFVLVSLNSAAWPDLGADSTVGRSPTASVQINDARISSVHATITADRRILNSSTNGIWINGARMERGGAHALAHGDIVTLCAPTLAQSRRVFGEAMYAAWRVEAPGLSAEPAPASAPSTQSLPARPRAAVTHAAEKMVRKHEEMVRGDGLASKPTACAQPAATDGSAAVAAAAQRYTPEPTVARQPAAAARASRAPRPSVAVPPLPPPAAQAPAPEPALADPTPQPLREAAAAEEVAAEEAGAKGEAGEEAEGGQWPSPEQEAGAGAAADDDDEFGFKEPPRPSLSAARAAPGGASALGKRPPGSAVFRSAAARPRLAPAEVAARGARVGGAPCSDVVPKAHANLDSIFAHLRSGRAA